MTCMEMSGSGALAGLKIIDLLVPQILWGLLMALSGFTAAAVRTPLLGSAGQPISSGVSLTSFSTAWAFASSG